MNRADLGERVPHVSGADRGLEDVDPRVRVALDRVVRTHDAGRDILARRDRRDVLAVVDDVYVATAEHASARQALESCLRAGAVAGQVDLGRDAVAEHVHVEVTGRSQIVPYRNRVNRGVAPAVLVLAPGDQHDVGMRVAAVARAVVTRFHAAAHPVAADAGAGFGALSRHVAGFGEDARTAGFPAAVIAALLVHAIRNAPEADTVSTPVGANLFVRGVLTAPPDAAGGGIVVDPACSTREALVWRIGARAAVEGSPTTVARISALVAESPAGVSRAGTDPHIANAVREFVARTAGRPAAVIAALLASAVRNTSALSRTVAGFGEDALAAGSPAAVVAALLAHAVRNAPTVVARAALTDACSRRAAVHERIGAAEAVAVVEVRCAGVEMPGFGGHVGRGHEPELAVRCHEGAGHLDVRLDGDRCDASPSRHLVDEELRRVQAVVGRDPERQIAFDSDHGEVRPDVHAEALPVDGADLCGGPGIHAHVEPLDRTCRSTAVVHVGIAVVDVADDPGSGSSTLNRAERCSRICHTAPLVPVANGDSAVLDDVGLRADDHDVQVELIGTQGDHLHGWTPGDTGQVRAVDVVDSELLSADQDVHRGTGVDLRRPDALELADELLDARSLVPARDEGIGDLRIYRRRDGDRHKDDQPEEPTDAVASHGTPPRKAVCGDLPLCSFLERLNFLAILVPSLRKDYCC